ncbi:MAG: hypothetical protein D6824_00485 [Planctomycetota bacterium]|nr:MAG: hypothetical protein D6824_00485 [Planctomycetota bacterium]
MATFRFKLERVLEQRRLREQETMRALAELERDRLAIEHELATRQRQIAQAKDDLREALARDEAPIDLTGVRLQKTASLHLLRRAHDAALRLAGVMRKLEQARKVYLEARAARQAVELLKERARARWLAAERKADQNAMDEIASVRFVRDRLGS